MKKIRLFMLILVSLVLIRFIDLTIIWNLGKAELHYLLKTEEWESKNNCYYTFLGFKGYESAKAELLSISNEREEKVIIVSYYTLLSPAVFLIHNKDSGELIFLPWDAVQTYKGITEVTFYKCDLARIKSNDHIEYKIVPVIGTFLSNLKVLFDDSIVSISWGIDYSMYLNKIYMFYFFFPLILILVFSYVFSKAVFVSFSYYFIMILFLLSKSYGEYPIISTFKIFYGYGDINLIPLLLFLVISTLCVYVLFFLGIKQGLKVIKEKGVTYNEKIVIWCILSLILLFRL